MNNVIQKLAASGLLALAAGAASAGDVTVNYIQPERFSDLPFTAWDREDALKNLTEHFAKLGAKLPPDQHLRIDVTDIDLAGREVPSRRGHELRIIKQNSAEWPRMELHYTLERNGQVLRSGDARLSDMAFMDRIGRYSDGDPLRYERRMIDDWFYETIMPRERSARR
ncbi:DUF3016 domain-containing protein [Massilia sp. Mn16-1_5]|uniref:DUF3016 domain-containing protein n=1 Tax=Massilia sp. Mn16-1_5 TaxID=2079199 RepID=UPI00109EB8F9|nr:DUF3016 domain-containing protein [Massilia sp. Mn16-1_5]THC44279.1 DUF3016 domain-containing protein [Massilia sp. Mn16-1_5]